MYSVLPCDTANDVSHISVCTLTTPCLTDGYNVSLYDCRVIIHVRYLFLPLVLVLDQASPGSWGGLPPNLASWANAAPCWRPLSRTRM